MCKAQWLPQWLFPGSGSAAFESALGSVSPPRPGVPAQLPVSPSCPQKLMVATLPSFSIPESAFTKPRSLPGMRSSHQPPNTTQTLQSSQVRLPVCSPGPPELPAAGTTAFLFQEAPLVDRQLGTDIWCYVITPGKRLSTQSQDSGGCQGRESAWRKLDSEGRTEWAVSSSLGPRARHTSFRGNVRR